MSDLIAARRAVLAGRLVRALVSSDLSIAVQLAAVASGIRPGQLEDQVPWVDAPVVVAPIV